MVKDYCYASLFDKKDLPYLYKYAAKVRETHNQQLVDDFNLKCQQKYDDHNPILGDNIEILQVSKADDLVVTAGIDQCINQILGTSVVRWQFVGKGTGSTTPAAGNTTLVTEVLPRVDMSLYGWREYAGASLRFAGIFGESNPTIISIRECGIFTTSTVGTMLNRNMFSNFVITPQQGVNGYVISGIIEFVPVV